MRKRRGFTLIEIIITIVVLSIISTLFAAYIRTGIDVWLRLRAENMLQAEGRTAASHILENIRGMQGRASITVMTTSEVEFFDGDGVTHNYQIAQSGSDYLLNYNGVFLTSYLAPAGLQFVYLDHDGNQVFSASAVEAIRFRLLLRYGEDPFSIETACRLRIL